MRIELPFERPDGKGKTVGRIVADEHDDRQQRRAGKPCDVTADRRAVRIPELAVLPEPLGITVVRVKGGVPEPGLEGQDAATPELAGDIPAQPGQTARLPPRPGDAPAKHGDAEQRCRQLADRQRTQAEPAGGRLRPQPQRDDGVWQADDLVPPPAARRPQGHAERVTEALAVVRLQPQRPEAGRCGLVADLDPAGRQRAAAGGQCHTAASGFAARLVVRNDRLHLPAPQAQRAGKPTETAPDPVGPRAAGNRRSGSGRVPDWLVGRARGHSGDLLGHLLSGRPTPFGPVVN
jgi:hypothetical protein